MKPMNLEPLRKFIEAQMTDQIVVLDDVQGSSDDIFDDTTGLYTPPDGDSDILYHGPARITSQGWAPTEIQRGGTDMILVRYEVALPRSTRKISKDSVIIVESSFRYQNLVNVKLFVLDTLDVSNAIAQKLLTEQRILRRAL